MLDKLLNLIEEKKATEEALKNVTSKLKEELSELDLSEFANLDYETTKSIYDSIHYYANKDIEKELTKLLEKKKAEKYPELLKPTYYPEIDTLNISAEEKLRLDSAARANVRNYISKYNCSRMSEPLTVEDLENLYSLGIVTKVYSVDCTNCGERLSTVSEEDLKNYRRAWALQRTDESELSSEEKEELSRLYKDGYAYLFVCCPECDEYELEITTQKEMDELIEQAEVYYKFIKQPDLQYESL